MPRKPPSRIIVVTGASNGLGRALALEFALGNDALALGSRRDGPLESVRRDCEALRASALASVTDPNDPDATFTLANLALTRFKRIDVWINYAPPHAAGAAADFALYENGAAAALAAFKAQGYGVLVNIDPYVDCDAARVTAEQRRAVRQAFARIARDANAVPGVRSTVAYAPRRGRAAPSLASAIVSRARFLARRGVAGPVLGAVERGRYAISSRFERTHRRAPSARSGRLGKTAKAAEQEAPLGWHLGSLPRSGTRTFTSIASMLVLIGVPLVAAVTALAMVL